MITCLFTIGILFSEDCQAGFARSQSGQCVQCPRGYWRDLNHNECQKCERDYTTKEGEVAICKEQCTEGRFFHVIDFYLLNNFFFQNMYIP